MSFALNEIGRFQFENLVMNRIPFLLLNIDYPVEGLFPPYHQKHLESQMVQVTKETALKEISARGLAKDHAIVVLAKEPTTAQFLGDELAKAGYQNSYLAFLDRD